MGKTSNNSGTSYAQIKVSVSPKVAEAFKAVCQAEKVSMAGELSKFMTIRSGTVSSAGGLRKDLLSSRGDRRKRVFELIRELEQIKSAEERYRDAIPENLTSSVRYDNAEESINVLEEVIAALAGAY